MRAATLLTKRALHKKVMPGRWTVPGGTLEPKDYREAEPSYLNDESPQWYGIAERVLRREIREEVGLEVDDIRYLLDLVFIHPNGTPVLVLSYFCRYESGDIVLTRMRRNTHGQRWRSSRATTLFPASIPK